MTEYYRKDCAPQNTKQSIENIFNDIDIKIVKIKEYSFSDLWYSSRYEFDTLPGVGTNGKGVSQILSEVSGLAEMLERIQTGLLLDRHFPYMKTSRLFFPDEIIRGFSNVFLNDSIFLNKTVGRKISKLNRGVRFAPFLNVLEKKIEYLPIELLELSCGSNGACAGNTFFEAVVQGISELFERHVLDLIFSNNIRIKVYDDICLKELKSFQLLQKLEEVGFEYRVIDCSMGGRFPVLGLLVFDKFKTKYKYSFAADPQFDIALQRCITEMFQGIEYVKTVSALLDVDYMNFEDRIDMSDYRINGSNSYKEWINCITTGEGQIPYYLFLYEKTYEIKGFIKSDSSEKNFEYMLDVIRKNNLVLYIRDYGYLGFHTYRVFIPNISEVFSINNEYLFQLKKRQAVIKSLQQCNFNKHTLKVMQKMKKNYNYEGAYKSLFNIIVDEHQMCNIAIDKVLSQMKGKRSDTYKLREWIHGELISNRNTYYGKQIEELVDMMTSMTFSKLGIFERKILTGLRNESWTENSKLNTLAKVRIPNCPNCRSCDLKDCCMYNEWFLIYEKLSKCKMNSFPNQTSMMQYL